MDACQAAVVFADQAADSVILPGDVTRRVGEGNRIVVIPEQATRVALASDVAGGIDVDLCSPCDGTATLRKSDQPAGVTAIVADITGRINDAA